MSINQNTKLVIIAFALVGAVLLGLNYMVTQEDSRDGSWLFWIALLLLIALLVWLWLRRDDADSVRQDAQRKAEDAVESAKQLAEQTTQAADFKKIAEESKATKSVEKPKPKPTQEEIDAKLAGAERKYKDDDSADEEVSDTDAPETSDAESDAAADAPASVVDETVAITTEDVEEEPEVDDAPAEEPVVETPPAPEPKETKAPDSKKKPASKKVKWQVGGKDNLKLIEGIGPKMEKALQAAGLDTFEKLSQSDEDTIRAAIKAAGMRFAPSVPTWAEQASYAAKEDMDGLQAYQDSLTAGRPPKK